MVECPHCVTYPWTRHDTSFGTGWCVPRRGCSLSADASPCRPQSMDMKHLILDPIQEWQADYTYLKVCARLSHSSACRRRCPGPTATASSPLALASRSHELPRSMESLRWYSANPEKLKAIGASKSFHTPALRVRSSSGQRSRVEVNIGLCSVPSQSVQVCQK